MKKRIVAIFVVLVFLLMPVLVLADRVSYTIPHYYIDASLLPDGDVSITELIVLEGSFNGYVREITYQNASLGSNGYESNQIYNPSGILMEEISAKKVDAVSFATLNDSDFKILRSGYGANLGYVESNINNGISYKMYFKSEEEQVAFRLKYRIKDVAVLHQDVGELYYTFIGSDYSDSIHDLQIRVHLPKKDDSGLLKYGHMVI